MWDYMTALQRRFLVVSQQTQNAERDAETAYDTLHTELSREQQRLLLRLHDAYTLHKDDAALDSFISGFRLADGIHRELAKIPPYSYEQESEELGRELLVGEMS